MAYANLNDDFAATETSAMVVTASADSGDVLFQSKVFTKFCTFGFVAVGSWDMTYVVVARGAVRVYDAEETFLNDPGGYVLEIKMNRQIFASQIFEKDYSKDKYNPIMIQYCYLLKDNGMWSPTKLLKIGTSDKSTLQRFINVLTSARC